MRRAAWMLGAGVFALVGAGCGSGTTDGNQAPAASATPAPPTPTGNPVMATPEPNDEIGLEQVDRHHALPPTYVPRDLVAIAPGYEPQRTYELRREAAEAWTRMHDAARAAGIELRVISAYRSFDYQQTVFDDAVRRMGSDQNAVAKPGHSEHQLGTAVDIAGPDKETVLQTAFGETPAGRWLAARAPDFGFAISYTAANRPLTGYIAEPWHYRYVGAAARARHDAALAGR